MADPIIDALYLTQAGDQIWFMRGSSAIRAYAKPAEDFFRSSFCRDARDIRLIALEANSALIAAAYRASADLKAQVRLVTPLGFDPRRLDHRTVLHQADELAQSKDQFSGSMGGWHVMRESELLYYEASAAAQRGASDEELVSTLMDTPLFRIATFCAPADASLLARLIARIRDPRWFISVKDPDRVTKLYAFLGIGQRPKVVVPERAMRSVAVGSWRPPGVSLVDDRDPRAWLYWHYNLMQSDEENRARLTTRVFVRYLRSIWLDLLRQEAAQPKRAEELFVPEHFFADVFRMDGADEATAAWRDAHVADIVSAFKSYRKNLLEG